MKILGVNKQNSRKPGQTSGVEKASNKIELVEELRKGIVKEMNLG
jgi:hypothetical protein